MLKQCNPVNVWFSNLSEMPLVRLKSVLTHIEPAIFSEGNLKIICPRGKWRQSQDLLIRPRCLINTLKSHKSSFVSLFHRA